MEEILVFLLLICVKGQDVNLPSKPDRCNRPAQFMYQHCCVFPPFFTRIVAKACGVKVVLTRRVGNTTGFRRMPLTLCDHWRCVLLKYGLLNADDTLDEEKYYSHLDRWVEFNAQFTDVIMKAKLYCKNEYRMFMPLKACEFYNLHGCIRNFVNVDCPVLFPVPECSEMKAFFDECKEFYL